MRHRKNTIWTHHSRQVVHGVIAVGGNLFSRTRKHNFGNQTIRSVVLKFDHLALQVTFDDYRNEVDHAGERIKRLEQAIDEAVKLAPAALQEVIAALQSLRGVAKVTAIGVVSEIGKFSRFDHPRKLMGYSGAVPSEYSSGEGTKRGGITKTGNSHVRRLLVEASWSYRHGPTLYPTLKKRQEGLSQEVTSISWRAQQRLCKRYRQLVGRGKPVQKVIVAVARELLGFIWEIAVHVEKQVEERKAA